MMKPFSICMVRGVLSEMHFGNHYHTEFSEITPLNLRPTFRHGDNRDFPDART